MVEPQVPTARAAPGTRASQGVQRCIVVAAGGTGGHLFPAFALAEELQRRGYAVELMTDMRGDRYGSGFPARAIHKVHSATLKGRSPLALANTGATLARGVREAYALLGRIKPSAVVGFGGYSTFPPLLAARLRKIPTALHEQNAVMGRANRMLARRATAIAASFEGTKSLEPATLAKTTVTGNPVRQAVIDWSRQPYAAPDQSGPIRLLVFGGSQGARYFSESVPPALALLPSDLRQRLSVVQQCREEDLAAVKDAFARAEIATSLAVFFPNLPEIMASSHLVIARAGASSVAELAVMGRPSVLVPLPHALDNDQLQNATRLAESGGCWCIEQKALSPERLAQLLEQVFREPARLSFSADAARRIGRPDAVANLAGLVERLAAKAAVG
jgi:UDP-N-acetylglucosamine--N-acetylmuramyl-(pentapeptide) pyrophosphoryl-undecaprenol N-acetylglucosamine transferase